MVVVVYSTATAVRISVIWLFMLTLKRSVGSYGCID